MKNRNSWLDTVNPIRGLSISQAKSIFDCARKHGSALLQKIYDEIENTDPTLMTCVDRRAAAISGIGWQVVARASAKDQNLADQQRLAVDGFLSGIENFDEALEHLDLAFFRGFSHCQPIWEADGTVKRINLLNSWNFLRDKDGAWYFNPEASSDLTGCEKIMPEARLMTLSRRRAIDWPALVIYIRKSLGEQDWGRYVERYGLPNFIATMHQGADEKQRDEYLKAAKAIRDAQPAALPSGGTVTTVGTESRGQDPFSNFIEHQEKLIVLMATGGTLTSLAQADTGSLAGGAQMDVWREIVRRDVSAISAVVNRALVRPFLEQKFPGAEIACEFKIEASEKPGKKETAELAATLKNAGYTINQSELEEAVGFSLEKSEPAPAPSTPFLNKETPDKKKPGNALATALQDAFEEAIGEAMAEELEGKTAANKKDAQGNEHDEGDGQFTSQGGNGSENISETKLMQRQRSCQEALRAYKASTDHPSVEDVVSGKVDIRDALKKGFEATFGGQKVVFFTQEKIGDKYDGRGEHGRIAMIKHVLAVRSNMFPVRHHGEQTGLVERLTSKNSNQRHVVTIDSATGIAVNVMRCSDAYIRRNYKK